MKAMFAAAALTLATVAWAAGEEVRPAVHAVLVGVGKYRNANGVSLRNLDGPVNDVGSMHKVLVDRYGLKQAAAVVLTDEAATREAIFRALDRMIDVAAPGDVVLFYFAGHGSRAYDGSIDEASQYDDTILPSDARDSQGAVPDITDDELGEVVAKALAKGTYPVVVLDSCHSGTGIRFWARSRSAPPLVAAAQTAGRGKASARRRGSDDREAVLLAAAQDSEEALESERTGTVRGEFTQALVRVLEAAEPGVTYLDVLTRVRVGLAGHGVPQHPQGEGDLERRFLGAGPLGSPPVLASPSGPRDVRLAAGAASGITVGSEYALFATAADASRALGAVAVGKVVAVGPATAEIVLRAEAALPTPSFAVELAHDFGDLRLKLAMSGGTEAERLDIGTALSKIEFVEVVPGAEATYWVDLSAAGVQLRRSDGSTVGPVLPVAGFADADGAVLMGRLAHYHALLRLRNPAAPASPIGARVVLSERGSDAVTNPRMRDGEAVIKPGQTYKISLFNTGSVPKHVYLLNLDAEYCVRLLSPPRFGSDEPLKGLQRTKLLKAPDTTGREYFLVLAADRPVALEALEQPCLTEGLLRDGAARTFDDPLARLLRNAGATRRGSSNELPVDGWATGFLSVVVEK